MRLKNTDDKYGPITKLLHWVIAILFMCQFYWIYAKKYLLTKGDPIGIQYLKYYHKSVGALLLFIGILAIIWKLMNIKPKHPGGMSSRDKKLANFAHKYYLLLSF